MTGDERDPVGSVSPLGPLGPLGPRVPADSGGDAACWIDMLCPECGAMTEGEGALDPAVPCWRCGTVRATFTEGE